MLDAGSAFASAGDCIKIWDATADHLHLNTHYTTEGFTGSSSFKDVSWNVNNTRLACISNGNGIVLYNFQEGVKHEGRELSKSKEQTALCFGGTKDELYSGGATGDLNLWNCNTFELTKTYAGTHGSAVRRLTRMGDRVVSASATGDLFIWQTSTSSILTKLKISKPKSIRGLGHSKYDKTMLGTTSDDGVVSIWDVEKETNKHNFTSHGAPAMDLSFSTINALLLVSGGLDKKIIFYDAQAKNVVETITSVQPITSVCFMGNGMHVCAGTSMGNILLYDLRNNSEPLTNLYAHSTSVQRLVLQTLKERKRSSRTSSKSSEKKSRSKQETTVKQPTSQSSNQQQQTVKKLHETPPKKSSQKILETGMSGDIPKSVGERTSIQQLSNENSLPIELQTPVNHGCGAILSDRDTMGSYCEQLFSPVASINGSLHNMSVQQQLIQSKSRQPLMPNNPRLNTPLSYSSSQVCDTHSANESVPNGLHSISMANHIVTNGIEDSYSRSHKPVLSSTPANVTSRASSSQCFDKQATASNQQITPSQENSLSTLVSGKQNVSNPAQSSPNVGMTFQYQLNFLKNTVHDLVQDSEENMRDELRHLHLQIIKMFTEQNEVIRQLAEQCSVNPLLLQEIERLRSENDRLRRKF